MIIFLIYVFILELAFPASSRFDANLRYSNISSKKKINSKSCFTTLSNFKMKNDRKIFSMILLVMALADDISISFNFMSSQKFCDFLVRREI